jgi:hypothetical protein
VKVEIVSIVHPDVAWPCLAGRVTLGNRRYYFTPHFSASSHIFGPDTVIKELPGACRVEEMDEDIVQNIIDCADAEERKRRRVMPYLREHNALFCEAKR